MYKELIWWLQRSDVKQENDKQVMNIVKMCFHLKHECFWKIFEYKGRLDCGVEDGPDFFLNLKTTNCIHFWSFGAF